MKKKIKGLIYILVIIAILVLAYALINKNKIRKIEFKGTYDSICYQGICTGFEVKENNTITYYNARLKKLGSFNSSDGKAIMLSKYFIAFDKEGKIIIKYLKTNKNKEISDLMFGDANYFIYKEKDKEVIESVKYNKIYKYDELSIVSFNKKKYFIGRTVKDDKITEDFLNDEGKILLKGYNIEEALRSRFLVLSKIDNSDKLYYIYDVDKKKLYKKEFYSYSFNYDDKTGLIINKFNKDKSSYESINLRTNKTVKAKALVPSDNIDDSNYVLYKDSYKYKNQNYLLSQDLNNNICSLYNPKTKEKIFIEKGNCDIYNYQYYVDRINDNFVMTSNNNIHSFIDGSSLVSIDNKYKIFAFDEFIDGTRVINTEYQEGSELKYKTFIFDKDKLKEESHDNILAINGKNLFNREIEKEDFFFKDNYSHILDLKTNKKIKIDYMTAKQIRDIPYYVISAGNKTYLVKVQDKSLVTIYNGDLIDIDRRGLSYKEDKNKMNYVDFYKEKTYKYKAKGELEAFPRERFNAYSNFGYFIVEKDNKVHVYNRKGVLLKTFKGYKLLNVHTYYKDLIFEIYDKDRKSILVSLR